MSRKIRYNLGSWDELKRHSPIVKVCRPYHCGATLFMCESGAVGVMGHGHILPAAAWRVLLDKPPFTDEDRKLIFAPEPVDRARSLRDLADDADIMSRESLAAKLRKLAGQIEEEA